MDGILYDESLNPIGEAIVKNGKIKSMSEECKKYHQKMKGEEVDESEEEVEEDEEEVDEEEVDEEEVDEPEPASEEDEDGDSSDEDSYDEETINKLKGGKGTLKNILKNIAAREKNSYKYGNIKKNV